MKINILVTGSLSEEGMKILEDVPNFHLDCALRLSSAELAQKISSYHGLIVRTEPPITLEIVEKAINLKLICRPGIGVDHIDLKACASHGITVMNTPLANRDSTVEFAFSLLLALARKIPQAVGALRKGQWDREKFVGTEINGKTLGIIGLGNIGSLVAARAKAFGMSVVAFDPYLAQNRFKELNVKSMGLSEMLNVSDFLSFHVPLTTETKNMASRSFFDHTQPHAFLINTSRGQVINEEALISALNQKKLAGAALDVFSTEPLPSDSPLRKLENVFLTPHEAGQTHESLRRMSLEGACQVRNFFLLGKIENQVTIS